MNCKDASSNLHELVDGELEPAEVEALEEHLAVCEDCRREYSLMQRCWDALSEDTGASVSPDFAGRVRRRAQMPGRLRRLAAAAAIIIALGGALLQFTNSPQQPNVVSDAEVIAELDVLIDGFDALEPMIDQNNNEPNNS